MRQKKAKALRKAKKRERVAQAKVYLDRGLAIRRRCDMTGVCPACGARKQDMQSPSGLIVSDVIHDPRCIGSNDAITFLTKQAEMRDEMVAVL